MSVISILSLPRDGYWYLATPYSKWRGGIDDAFRQAVLLAGKLIRAKLPVHSPIAHTHPIAIQCGMDPFDHSIWFPADEPLMKTAYGLLVADMEGWRESRGVLAEIDYFRCASRPIYLLDTIRLEASPL